jgi:hypothetical protein
MMKLNGAATTTFLSGCLLLAGGHFASSDAFVSPLSAKSTRDESVAFRQWTTKRYNFFKNMLEQAFENDGNLSKDISKGQYDAPGEEYKDIRAASQLTETQKRWREKQNTNDVTPAMIESKAWKVDLYLSGVPERDPSNDLYASKVNISSRDKATGLSIPEEPSTSTTIEFLENGVCRAVASDFTSGNKDGAWKLSDDGKMLRFSFDATGFTRNVQTKGSIQKIYWSKDEQVTRQTTSTYSIPPGWVYGDIAVRPGRQPGTLDISEDGVLRIEQRQGLMGASSKMVPCGKFRARTSLD